MSPPEIAEKSSHNPLKRLEDLGQSVWLDYIRRGLITTGELHRLVAEDGLKGLTSNPTIFQKAITGSGDYEKALASLRESHKTALEAYESLAVRDIREAADILRPVYEASQKKDGYACLEVSPDVARDTRRTVEEARRLWKALHRENVMIKVPATPEGMPAVEQLIAEGVNVNVTLLFSRTAYEAAANAYITGLERRASRGADLSGVAGVASFFVSRIDTAVDALLLERARGASDPGLRVLCESLVGKTAIANAKLAYELYLRLVSGERWARLAAKGAQPQRLLWASTSTKNPKYSDVLYIEELIGPDTVNTFPPATLDAFRDHGKARPSLRENVEDSRGAMRDLEACGVRFEDAAKRLLDDGVRIFSESFDALIETIKEKCREPVPPRISRQTYRLPQSLEFFVNEELETWGMDGRVRRLWSRDASLWTGADESRWLDWLNVVDAQLERFGEFKSLQEEVRLEKPPQVLLLGMGGSSLCAEVLKSLFGVTPGFPELHVLDSTDPAQILAFEKKIDLAKAWFLVSSKSGTTLEPDILWRYFWERARDAGGRKEAGRRFLAVTDPGSALEKLAAKEGFRRVFHGVPGIGGRYSALSDFGMVPAALMGVDVAKFLDRAHVMEVACSGVVPPFENPGVVLGAVLGVLAKGGRDKATFIASPPIAGFGAWLEQLIAESTGKNGRGIIPVDREPLGAPESYGDDRIFVYLRLSDKPDPSQDAAVEKLEGAGQAVVRFDVTNPRDAGQGFFRWEMATAVAGAILGINPFDQPDVEAGKAAARRMTEEAEKTGSLPSETPIFKDGGIRVFADAGNAKALAKGSGKPSLTACLKAHFDRLRKGDYFALLAYVEMNGAHENELSAIRALVRDSKRVATCLGFGPRFLHSTGQAYKGGPPTGVFLQITADDAKDLAVPGRKCTFGMVKAAQARGDFQVLAERGRRALRVHLGPDVAAGLSALRRAVEGALKS